MTSKRGQQCAPPTEWWEPRSTPATRLPRRRAAPRTSCPALWPWLRTSRERHQRMVEEMPPAALVRPSPPQNSTCSSKTPDQARRFLSLTLGARAGHRRHQGVRVRSGH